MATALLVNEYVAPRLEQLGDQRKAFAKYQDISFAGQGGAWMRDGDNIINVASQTSEAQFGGLLVFRFGADGRLDAIGRAARASNAQSGRWQVSDYRETPLRRRQHAGHAGAARELVSPNSAGFLQLAVAGPAQMALQTLRAAIDYRRANALDVSAYEFAFWSRVARTVALLVAMLFAVPFGYGLLRSSGSGARAALGLGVGLVYFFLQRIVESGTLVFGLESAAAGVGADAAAGDRGQRAAVARAVSDAPARTVALARGCGWCRNCGRARAARWRWRSAATSCCSASTTSCGRCATPWPRCSASALLQYLFTLTFVATLAVRAAARRAGQPLAAAQWLPGVFGFWLANLLLFVRAVPARAGQAAGWRAVSIIWFSVVNLYMISVFWSLMVDLFTSEQSTRLFAFIAAGGSIGSIAGPVLTSRLVGVIGISGLLLLAARGLVVVMLLMQAPDPREGELRAAGRPGAAHPASITSWRAVRWTASASCSRRPTCCNQAAFMLLMTWVNTVAYFLQTDILAGSLGSLEARTQALADIDLWVNVASAVILVFGARPVRAALRAHGRTDPQSAADGRLLRRRCYASPTLLVIQAIQVVRRVAQYAIARPSREMCFTVVEQVERYKAKSVIDTVVYRFGDCVRGLGAGAAARARLRPRWRGGAGAGNIGAVGRRGGGARAAFRAAAPRPA